MPVEYQTPAIEDPAVEVQILLADQGWHRAPSVADLIVAATAELTVLVVPPHGQGLRTDGRDDRTSHRALAERLTWLVEVRRVGHAVAFGLPP